MKQEQNKTTKHKHPLQRNPKNPTTHTEIETETKTETERDRDRDRQTKKQQHQKTGQKYTISPTAIVNNG